MEWLLSAGLTIVVIAIALALLTRVKPAALSIFEKQQQHLARLPARYGQQRQRFVAFEEQMQRWHTPQSQWGGSLRHTAAQLVGEIRDHANQIKSGHQRLTGVPAQQLAAQPSWTYLSRAYWRSRPAISRFNTQASDLQQRLEQVDALLAALELQLALHDAPRPPLQQALEQACQEADTLKAAFATERAAGVVLPPQLQAFSAQIDRPQQLRTAARQAQSIDFDTVDRAMLKLETWRPAAADAAEQIGAIAERRRTAEREEQQARLAYGRLSPTARRFDSGFSQRAEQALNEGAQLWRKGEWEAAASRFALITALADCLRDYDRAAQMAASAERAADYADAALQIELRQALAQLRQWRDRLQAIHVDAAQDYDSATRQIAMLAGERQKIDSEIEQAFKSYHETRTLLQEEIELLHRSIDESQNALAQRGLPPAHPLAVRTGQLQRLNLERATLPELQKLMTELQQLADQLAQAQGLTLRWEQERRGAAEWFSEQQQEVIEPAREWVCLLTLASEAEALQQQIDGAYQLPVAELLRTPEHQFNVQQQQRSDLKQLIAKLQQAHTLLERLEQHIESYLSPSPSDRPLNSRGLPAYLVSLDSTSERDVSRLLYSARREKNYARALALLQQAETLLPSAKAEG